MTIPSRAGQGAQILKAIGDAGINMQAFTGFPAGGGKSQVDFVTGHMSALRRLAKKQGWRLSTTRKAFLVQGSDEVGAIEKVIKRLADVRINIVAVDAVAAGSGRYGMILWVNPKDYSRAARALNAK